MSRHGASDGDIGRLRVAYLTHHDDVRVLPEHRSDRCRERQTRLDVDLLLVDLEMPALDGTKIFSFAVSIGMDKNRIVILSGRDSDYLHEQFPMGTCLAVLNKYEVKQKAVLDMIFSSMQRKAAA